MLPLDLRRTLRTGNQFIHRVTLFVMDIGSLRKGETQPAYVELVPMGDTMKFTALQLLALSVVYGVTWAGIYGISFPLFIMALVPLRQFVLVKLFPASSLRHLDMAGAVCEMNFFRLNPAALKGVCFPPHLKKFGI